MAKAVGLSQAQRSAKARAEGTLEIYKRDPRTGRLRYDPQATKERGGGTKGGTKFVPGQGGINPETGLPSIRAPSEQQVREFNAKQTAQKAQAVNEAVLKDVLSRPTQTIQQRFMQVTPVSSEVLSEARKALNKPAEQRTEQERAVIVEATGTTPVYQEEVTRLEQQRIDKLNQAQEDAFVTQRELQRGTSDLLKEKTKNPFFQETAMQLEERSAYFRSNVPKEFNLGLGGKNITNPYYALGRIGYGALSTGVAFGVIGEDVLFGGGKLTQAALGEIVYDPIATGRAIGLQAQEDPFAFIGSYFAGTSLIKGVGTTIRTGVQEASVVGKTFIPSEKLVVPEVASGVKTFPTASSINQAISKFEKESFKTATGRTTVYSATDYPFTPIVGREITVTAGRGIEKSADVPGLYTSTRGVSTYFLRLESGLPKEYSLLPKSIIPNQPKILAVEGIPTRIPAVYRSNLTKAQSFFGKEGKEFTVARGTPGKPYYSPALEFGLKNEAEAVIQVGSKLRRVGMSNVYEKITGFSKFTRVKGRVVPIYEYEAIGAGAPKLSSKISKVSSYDVSSQGVKVKPIVSYSRTGSIALSAKGVPAISEAKLSKYVADSVPYIRSRVSSLTPSRASFSGSSVTRVPSRVQSSVSYKPSTSEYSQPYSEYAPSTISSTSFSTTYKPKYPSQKYTTTYPRSFTPALTNKKREDEEKKLKKRVKGFRTFVRKKGKFVELDKEILPKGFALEKGTRAVQQNLTRSVQIKEAGYIEVERDIQANLQGFRPKKLKSKIPEEPVFVQINALSNKLETDAIQEAKKFSKLTRGK